MLITIDWTTIPLSFVLLHNNQCLTLMVSYKVKYKTLKRGLGLAEIKSVPILDTAKS